jgi:hypothetical protein
MSKSPSALRYCKCLKDAALCKGRSVGIADHCEARLFSRRRHGEFNDDIDKGYLFCNATSVVGLHDELGERWSGATPPTPKSLEDEDSKNKRAQAWGKVEVNLT